VTEVSVTCGCGRKMAQRGTDPAGTYRCVCGARVSVTVERKVTCVWLLGTDRACRITPVREAVSLGLPLCLDHFPRLAELFEALQPDEITVSARLAELAERQRQAVEAEGGLRAALGATFTEALEWRGAEKVARAGRDAQADWYVYYIRIGNRIKIGTTGDFKRRMGQLMPDEVLAIEPGGYALEKERLGQFRRWRLIGERFAPAPDLMEHIAAVRKQYGNTLPLAG
jgi:hypothetical protein